MLRLIWRILVWLRGGTLKLLLLAVFILIIWGITSPVGTVVWWLEQGAETLGLKKNQSSILPPNNDSNPDAKSSPINCYIVFLTGVGDFSANELTPGEEVFLDRIVESHPNCVAVGDVFPYSAENKGLGGQRLLSPVWHFANRNGGMGIASVLIKIRNLWRFAISADPRYGSIYNQGIANAIIERMNSGQPISRKGGQPLDIILVGTSGGVQVALGAAPYLNQWLDTKITIVSVGGVFNGRSGFQAARFYHLRGSRDWVEDLGGIVFPSRWLWNVSSQFNQARLQGHYSARSSGSHAHDGPEGYFGLEVAKPEDMTYVELTLQEVNKLPIWSLEKPAK
ncbi:hypothetical protein H6F78_06560 [Coleofasciculus sp. FACHB-64]|uniref:hypothetical protein n=1 Tax=Cyanophyceae TaxID=3028117 RepID=UPI0016856BE2|nr:MULTISPECIES: hypothetical protein [unclassified Coleofasciculus]MBD1879190.1 hypothetical protein [Coleofasciculus sp. FACHB-T130]MBD1902251.1 hypothetical protein [Coleofasciculus sp. FACHB-125]MBD2045260.1 hypothetical protein [Coleofasciculus sp. FACHB-64]